MNNQFHGKGILHSSDGGKYDGRFEKGNKQGYGVQYSFDGTIYKGNWLQGKKDGFGVFIGKNKTVEGYWKDDMFQGEQREVVGSILSIPISIP